MDKINKKERIAILGGGITGIAAALYLAKTGRFDITLFEKESQIGGLSTYYQWTDIRLDKFYHVILSTDSHTLAFIDELGLSDQLFWKETRSGFYGDGRLVSMSTIADFIKFPFLSLFQKVRLGFGILYSTQIKNPEKLDKINVREWLTKVFGRRVYENLWDPLLRSKLGSARERTSAAFIWATIKRLYGTREGASKQERMGHVNGGYYTILKAAEKKLKSLGVTIITNAPIIKIIPSNYIDITNVSKLPHQPIQQSRSRNKVTLLTNDNQRMFDKVLFTANCQAFSDTVDLKKAHNIRQKLEDVEYLGVVCLLLILSRNLSPYYVINILDKDLPFTGIIEVTNIISPERIGKRHLVYLPKYLPSDDPLTEKSDKEIERTFIDGLRCVFPDLAENEILHKKLFREQYVQPLQKRNHLSSKLDFEMSFDHVRLLNTSMLYNTTLNNNAAIGLSKKAVISLTGNAIA